jgi:allophanate hydrolase
MTAIDLDIARLHAAYARGLDPQAVMAEVFARIAAADDPGIFITLLDPADVAERAEALGAFDPTKPLWGVPFAIKDNIDLAGVPTTAACPDYAYVPERDATVVARLVAAGAVPIGKTNLDQFATGLVGVRTPYPAPRNACAPDWVPGGSSAGSGIAVARGLVSFALGTDTAGSGRVPAALNNVVGLKPSVGALPNAGSVPACRTLDCISVFATTVPDAWTVAAAAWGYDAADAFSTTVPLARPALPPVLRIGAPDGAGRRFFGDGQAEAAFDAALALLDPFGPRMAVDMAPLFAVAALLYEGAWVAERYVAIRGFIEAKPDSLYPVTRSIIEGARKLSAADAFAGVYRRAELARKAAALWDRIDVLVVPSIPAPCTLADVAADPIGANSRLGTYTNFVNLLNLCALAVPGPFRGDGLPAGVTLIAPAGRDGLLAAIGERLHAAAGVPLGATGRPLPPMPLRDVGPPAGTIEVAVVGAHLSGMPLNRELTDRGASFVRRARTRPCYRLHVLAGSGRPGLVRVGDGAAIEAEIWALPPVGFAELVASIPAPLGLGTVLLDDGTAVKGYLCEAEGVRGAEDISRFGGWRAYVNSQAASARSRSLDGASA